MDDRSRELLDRLRSDGAPSRRSAAVELGLLGDPAVAPALAECLRDAVAAVREGAMEALVELGQRHGDALARVVRPYLADEVAATRNAAAEVLGALGPPAEEAVRELLDEADPDLRRMGAELLARVGSSASVAALAERLEDDDPNVASAAAEALGAIGEEGAVEPLRRLAGHSEPWLRCAACRALGEVGTPEARASVARLLRDPEPVVRFAALEALGRGAGLDVLPELVPPLRSGSSRERAAAIRAVAAVLEREGRPAVERLREAAGEEPLLAALEHPERAVRRLAAQLLGELGSRAAVPALAEVLVGPAHRDDPELREIALRALDQGGAVLRRDELERALDESLSVEGRCELVDLLGRLEVAEAGPALDRLAAGGPVLLRRVAVRQLPRVMGTKAIPRLADALEDADEGVRLHAARGVMRLAHAFGDLEPELQSRILRLLRRGLGEEDAAHRAAAGSALAALARGGGLEVLLEVGRAGAGPERIAALRALGPVAASESVQGLLADCLADPDPEVRRAAASAAAGLPEGSAVVAAVERALRDGEPEVRRAAAEALRGRSADRVLPALLAALAAERDDRVRGALARAIGGTPGPGSVEALVRILEDGEAGPLALLGALEGLRDLAEPGCLAAVEAVTEHPDPEVSEAAFETLAALAAPPGCRDEAAVKEGGK